MFSPSVIKKSLFPSFRVFNITEARIARGGSLDWKCAERDVTVERGLGKAVKGIRAKGAWYNLCQTRRCRKVCG